VGYVNPVPSSLTSNAVRVFELGTGVAGGPWGAHRICWRPQSTSADVVELGRLTLHGPRQMLEAPCVLGVPCTVTLSGFGLPLGSWLAVIDADGESCGASGASLSELQGLTHPLPYASHGVGADADVAHNLGTSRNGTVGRYALCWTQGAGGVPNLVDFNVHVGTFSMSIPALFCVNAGIRRA